MDQPEGFVEKGQEDLSCHLQKTLYGLKQSGHEWNKVIDKEILSMGFKKSKADPCIYVFKRKEKDVDP